MSDAKSIPLLVGEISVDYTIAERGGDNKVRLGGIAHAARGFWAVDAPFSAAVVLPDYLEPTARSYLEALGCIDFYLMGRVRGAPNVTTVRDPIELADQEYDTLLREEKTVELFSTNLGDTKYRDVLVFPGSYDLKTICEVLPKSALLHMDVAYDLNDPTLLAELPQKIQTILISTSSPLFKSLSDQSLVGIADKFKSSAPTTLILKENRGGARMRIAGTEGIQELPAQLGATKNSVGVGDVFAAVYVACVGNGFVEAGWRATYAASAYSQTSEIDVFKMYVQRDRKVAVDEMEALSGVVLPWEKRREYPIYLAAPDFSYGDRRAIDKAIASLTYHNFFIRRPVLENRELPGDADAAQLDETYRADRELLRQCVLVFAVPTGRDPGTLVEIGIAFDANIPVVVYDPTVENANAMVIAGASHYSADLDECLNATFRILSKR